MFRLGLDSWISSTHVYNLVRSSLLSVSAGMLASDLNGRTDDCRLLNVEEGASITFARRDVSIHSASPPLRRDFLSPKNIPTAVLPYRGTHEQRWPDRSALGEVITLLASAAAAVFDSAVEFGGFNDRTQVLACALFARSTSEQTTLFRASPSALGTTCFAFRREIPREPVSSRGDALAVHQRPPGGRMARCASLRSRTGARPLSISGILGQQEHMNLPTIDTGGNDDGANSSIPLPGDALDFFGTIRNLVEQSIQPEDLQKYASHREQGEFLTVNSNAGGGGGSRSGASSPQHLIVEQLRRENGALRGKVWELELALQESQENSHRLVSGRGTESAARGGVSLLTSGVDAKPVVNCAPSRIVRCISGYADATAASVWESRCGC